MPLNEYSNKPIFKNKFDVDPSGDLEIDIKRIEREKDQSSIESATYQIFTDVYVWKCYTVYELVELFDRLRSFFKEHPDPENGFIDMYRRVFFGHISGFDVIPAEIKEKIREEYSKMKETYEMSKTVPVIEKIMSKPSE